jgi:transposase
MIDKFCINNSIIYIKSRPRHPQTNGVVEVVNKEIRKLVLIKYAEFEKDFDLKTTILDGFNAHNHNVHPTTGYKPCFIINNTEEEIEKKVLENIKKSIKLTNEE